MPRPTEAELPGSRGDAQGFGPSQPSNYTTGVVAPLNVTGAPAAAQQLIASLQGFNQHAQDALGIQARLAGSDAETKGAAWGMLHPGQQPTKDDAPEVAQGDAFAMGVHRAQTTLKAHTAADQITQFTVQNPGMPLHGSTDANGNHVPGLLEHWEQIAQAAFPNGEDKDPAAAKVIYPILNQAYADNLREVYRKTVADGQDKIRSAFGLDLRDRITNNGAPNIDGDIAKLKDANLGDPKKSRDDYVEALAEQAIATKNPDAVDKFAPRDFKFANGATWSPENLAKLDLAKKQAAAASEKDMTLEQYKTAARFSDLQTNGHIVPEKDIQDALSNHLISEGGALHLHGMNAQIQLEAAERARWGSFFNSGNHWSTTGLDPVDVRKHEDELVDSAPPEQKVPFAVALTAKQGLMPNALKHNLETPALQDVNGLQQQLSIYAELRQRAPGAVAADIPAPARAVYDRAMQLSKTGMQPQEILKELQSYDPTAAKEAVEGARPEINTAIKTVSMHTGPGFLGFGHSNTTPNDYVNGLQVQTQIREQAELLVGRGFTPQAAVTTAAQNVYDASVTVKTPQGNLMIPRVGGEAADVGDAVKYLYENKDGVPALAKAHNIDPKDVRLTVQPGTDGRSALVLVGPNGETLKGPFTLNDLYASYTKATSHDKWQAGQDARAKSEANHRAFQAYTDALSTAAATPGALTLN